MNSNTWSDLPCEILNLIIKHAEPEYSRLPQIFGPDYYHYINRMQAFQLTCKHWSRHAQMFIYNTVHLYNMRQVRAFESALSQNRKISKQVHHIVSEFNDDLTIPFPHLIRISSFCSNVQNFHSESFNMKNQWLAIKQEENSGLLFNSLRTLIYLSHLPNHGNVNLNNSRAIQQRSFLNSVTLYDLPFLLVTAPLDPNDFEFALKINLVLDKNSPLLYQVGQQLDTCPAIQTMVISYHNNHLEQEENPSVVSTGPRALRIPCSHIKKLVLEMNEDSDWWMYNSLIAIFHNLDILTMMIKKNSTKNSRRRLSTENAIQFLNYLMDIPVYYIESLYVDNLTAVLREWLDLEHQIMRLDLNYIWREEEEEASCLSLWVTQERAKMCIQYASEQPYFLPELGMINNSGNTLESLTFDMGVDPFLLEQEHDVADNPLCDLSQIFFDCPNLTTLHVSHTRLTILKPELVSGLVVRSFDEMKIEKSFIAASFFFQLSDSVDYIGKLTVDKCKIVTPHDDRSSVFNHFIEMNNTSFDEILFGFNGDLSEFYLKIQVVKDETVTCRYYDGSSYAPCSELQFFEGCCSVPSLSVTCYKYKTIRFKNPKILTFEAPNPNSTN